MTEGRVERLCEIPWLNDPAELQAGVEARLRWIANGNPAIVSFRKDGFRVHHRPFGRTLLSTRRLWRAGDIREHGVMNEDATGNRAALFFKVLRRVSVAEMRKEWGPRCPKLYQYCYEVHAD